MKSLLSLLLVAAFGLTAFADIQEPPAADQTASRKLGRGLANVLFGISELPYQVCNVNDESGNSAGFSYGFVRGIRRTCFRFSRGWYDILTAPIPSYRGSYRQPYRSDMVWSHNGYSEFPPELGFETRRQYCRSYGPF